MNKAGQIFNLDKSGISFEHDAPNVVVGKGQKQIQSENKFQLTMVSCVNTVGQALPSLILFFNTNLDWTKREMPGTMYGLSENRWIDMALYSKNGFNNLCAMQD